MNWGPTVALGATPTRRELLEQVHAQSFYRRHLALCAWRGLPYEVRFGKPMTELRDRLDSLLNGRLRQFGEEGFTK